MAWSDLTNRRSILLSARMQFSPEVQPVKKTAIDKIVEQNLLIAQDETGLTVRDIEQQRIFYLEDGRSTIGRAQIEEALERLLEAGRIEKTNEPARWRDQRYRLTSQAYQKLEQEQKIIEDEYTNVVNRIFRNSKEPPEFYNEPFLDLLCMIFAHLGERYVQILKGDTSDAEMLDTPHVDECIGHIISKYDRVDGEDFRRGIVTFFSQNDPDYDSIKWGMAQNYYLLKALGLDETGNLLSQELFGNATLYLDTNVIIPALTPNEYYHESFKALSRACGILNIDMHVCNVTLEELKGLVSTRLELISKVADTIPPGLNTKVDDVFYSVYKKKSAHLETDDLSKIFEEFLNPRDFLHDEYNVQLVDDKWFLDQRGTQDINRLTGKVKEAYFKKKRRSKRDNAAEHDALLLRWVDREQKTQGKRAYVVTLDTSLPEISLSGQPDNKRPAAVMLDALLQWISPFGITEGEDKISAIFSEAVKQQLLPQDRFFQLSDFLVFSELEMNTKELPAEDVEACLGYLKQNAADLDIHKPEDREHMYHEVARFLADPGRKYQQEREHWERELQEKDKRIEELEEWKQQQEEERGKQQYRQSSILRYSGAAVVILGFQGIAILLVSQHGQGANLLYKIQSLLYVPSVALAVSLAVSAPIIGKERIKNLPSIIRRRFE